MNYKALVFDLDGTAIPSTMDGLPSDLLIEEINKAKKGLCISAATGRSWRYAKAPIQALGLTSPCIISGGAQIIDPLSESIIWGIYLSESDINFIRDFAHRLNKQVAYVSGLAVCDPCSPLDDPPKNVCTAYIFGILRHEHSLTKEYFTKSDINAAFTRSWFEPDVVDLHITKENATKQQAVEHLCSILTLEKSDLIGVGDGYNDLHLFDAVGLKVAMGNAEEELKRAADIVIGPQDEDGLGKLVYNIRAKKEIT